VRVRSDAWAARLTAALTAFARAPWARTMLARPASRPR
jgi:hypothetical protein